MKITEVKLTNGNAALLEDGTLVLQLHDKYTEVCEYEIVEEEVFEKNIEFDLDRYNADLESGRINSNSFCDYGMSPYHYNTYESTGEFVKVVKFAFKLTDANQDILSKFLIEKKG